MTTFKIDTREGKQDDYGKLAEHLDNLPPGLWEIEVRKPKRSDRQNNTIHAIFPDLAKELNGIGIGIHYGKFECSFTEHSAKEFFIECYLGGKRTSKGTTSEIANALNTCIEDINRAGGQLSIKNAEYYLNKQLDEN